MLLLHSVTDADYMQLIFPTKGASCREYTDEEVFQWNFGLWCTGFFFLGLQFTHTSIGPLKNFKLSGASIRKWGFLEWGIFLLGVTFIASILYVNFMSLIFCDCWFRYLIWSVYLGGFIVFNTMRLSPKRSLHIHHYALSFLMTSFIGYQSPILTIAHGFAVGTFIEGGARWGFDAIWEEVRDDDSDSDDLDEIVAKPGLPYYMKPNSKKQQRQRCLLLRAHQSETRK